MREYPSPNLDRVVVAVAVGEAQRAEAADVNAVEAEHVALPPVRVGMERALPEESGGQQPPQPRGPPPRRFLRPSSSLFPIQFF